MKCFTENQIQHLIDYELRADEKLQADKHLASCVRCREKFLEQKQFVEFFKTNMLSVPKQSAQPPAFKFQLQTTEVVETKKAKPYFFLLKAAAVLLPAFLLWKFYPEQQAEPEKFTPSTDQIMMYEMCNDVDANTAFQEKMIVTAFEDADGNVKYITN